MRRLGYALVLLLGARPVFSQLYTTIDWTTTSSTELSSRARAKYYGTSFTIDMNQRIFLQNDIEGPEIHTVGQWGYGNMVLDNTLSHVAPLMAGCYRSYANADADVGGVVQTQGAGTSQYCVPRVVDSPDDNVVCPGPGCGSPIILQLGIGPYRLTSAADGVTFDLRNEGRRRQVAWIAPGADIAFLALDRNGNDVIDNGSELFGDSTPLASGHYAENGFAVLAEFDANHDGIVDASDPVWSSLLLWNDRNHDGLSTPDELRPAAGAVAALETACHIVGRQDEWGNLFHYMADFRIDPSRERPRKYYDVFLRIDP